MAAILLIDTDLEQLERFRHALESHGHATLVAATAVSGVERLREGGIDAVVLHHTDPDRTEVFVEALQKLPDPPPFVMVSSSEDAPLLSARLGAAGFLPRPCAPEEILASIEQMLAARGTPSVIEEELPTRPVERPD